MPLSVMLDGVDISGRLVGTTMIEAVETAARIAELSYLPATPTSPGRLLGDALVVADGATRLFTGAVEDASRDLRSGVVSIRATDRLQEYAANLTEAQILSAVPGGLYSVEIFGERQSGWEQLLDVLDTVLAGYSLSPADGTTGRLHTWTTSGAAAATDTAYVEGTLSEARPSLGTLISVVDIAVEARFARRWHREVTAAWAAYGNFCDWYDDPTTLPSIDMISGAAAGTDWQIAGVSDAASCDPAANTMGVYTEGLPASHNDCSSPWILASDPDEATARVSANWTAYSRYVQWVREVYPITVTATGAPATTTAEHRWRIDQDYETDGWEGSAGDGVAPAGGTSIAGGTAWDAVDRSEITPVLSAAVGLAARDCIEPARDWTWTYQIPLDATADLGARRRLNCADGDATGDVVRVRHQVDHSTGRSTTEIEIALGGGSINTWALPTAPDTATGYATIPSAVSLPNHIGNDDSAPADDCAWTGYVGNYQFLAAGGGHGSPAPEQIYQDRFAVEYPEIDATHRDEKAVTATPLTVTVSMVYPA